jgi:hypothetical protein
MKIKDINEIIACFQTLTEHCFVPFTWYGHTEYGHWIISFVWYRNRAHGECDRSAEDASFSIAWNLILPLLLPGIRIALHSTLYFFLGLRLYLNTSLFYNETSPAQKVLKANFEVIWFVSLTWILKPNCWFIINKFCVIYMYTGENNLSFH